MLNSETAFPDKTATLRLLTYFSTSLLAILSLSLYSPWTRRWTYSGTALESLLLLFPPEPSLHRWSLLVGLNLSHLVVSTSWLLHALFTAACWILVIGTALAQSTTLSDLLRQRLRWLSKHLHLYHDRAAVFGLPVVILDTAAVLEAGVEGLISLQGFTFSFLDMKLVAHGLEISIVYGEEEITIYSESVEVRLFRRIVIGEMYAIHHPDRKGRSSGSSHPKVGEHQSNNLETTASLDAYDLRPMDKSDSAEIHHTTSRVVLTADVEAEDRYKKVLQRITNATRIHRCREIISRGRLGSIRDATEKRAAMAGELRKLGSFKADTRGRFLISSLLPYLRRINQLLERFPLLLRLILMPISTLHPTDMPSVCVAGAGTSLHTLLVKKFFHWHNTEDNAIHDLEEDVSAWLSPADFCLELKNIRAHALVPIRTTSEISATLSASGFVISRIDAATSDVDKIMRLQGADASFGLPTCLLPYHAHLVPDKAQGQDPVDEMKSRAKNTDTNEDRPSDAQDTDPNSDDPNDDTAKVSVSIRMTLPARFSKSFLTFATTLGKVTQILDIEESNGLPEFRSPSAQEVPQEQETSPSPSPSLGHKIKDKLAHGKLAAAMRHPADGVTQIVHKEVKMAAVKRVDGTWFAKWTNKILGQLEWVNGDVGYSMKLPIQLAPYRR